MPTLHKHLHIIVFVIFLILIAVLNAGPYAVGWPIPLTGNRVASWFAKAIVQSIVNTFPCIMILSLCMVPFAYDSKRSFSLGTFLQFTTAACFGFLILTPGYLGNYQPGDHLLIIVLTAMAMNGLLAWPIELLKNYVELPQWRTPERAKNGDPLDFD